MNQRLLMIAILFLVPLTAFAHRPYVFSEGVIESPTGAFLIKERLNGDGVFFKDPVSFQLRSKGGAVLAATPSDFQVATFCPAVWFCWAFPYGHLMPVRGWYLDISTVDFERGSGQALSTHLSPNDDEQRFRNYLAGGTDYFASYALEYPSERVGADRPMPTGFVESDWSIILSPLVILMDQWVLLLTIIWLMCFLYAMWLAFFQSRRIPSRAFAYTVQTCIASIASLVAIGALLILAFGTFAVFMPISVVLVAIMMGGAVVAFVRSATLHAFEDASRNALA